MPLRALRLLAVCGRAAQGLPLCKANPRRLSDFTYPRLPENCPGVKPEHPFPAEDGADTKADGASRSGVLAKRRAAGYTAGTGTGVGHMTKKRVYVETSVLGWLTAKPCNDILKMAKQQQTKNWWKVRHRWDCFLTTTVLVEIKRGDSEAAARRWKEAQTLPELPPPPEADDLAGLLLARKLVPQEAAADAHHLAEAALLKAHYLLTCNQTHLDNLELRSRIEELIRGWGLTPAKVITPGRLLEETT